MEFRFARRGRSVLDITAHDRSPVASDEAGAVAVLSFVGDPTRLAEATSVDLVLPELITTFGG